MTEGAMNLVLDALADRIAARLQEKLSRVPLVATPSPANAPQTPANAPQTPQDAEKQCDTCGNAMAWKRGVTKAGKAYSGWYCHTLECRGRPL